jgi:NitT/TauT family transport system substrate-binding protein
MMRVATILPLIIMAMLGSVPALTTTPGPTSSPAPVVVVLAVDGVNQTRNLPVLLAARLGYFEDVGLAVRLIDAPAHPSPIELIQSGRADGAVAFYHHTIMTQAHEHLFTQAVITMGAAPGLRLLVAARLRNMTHSIADLKGRRIFTGGVNSGKTTSVNWLMLHAGLGIDDYAALPTAKYDAIRQALGNGTADAAILHEPDASRLVATGAAFELADLETVPGTKQALGTIFPSTALYLPKSYIAAHPDTVRRLVVGCKRALAFIKDHDAAAIVGALPPAQDPEAFKALIAQDKKMFETDGMTPPDAAKAEWQAMTALTPAYGAIAIDETFTNAFMISR